MLNLPSFSVLMSVYYKEQPIYLDQAFESIWDLQSLKPNEIVLVIDGHIGEELLVIVKKWKSKLGNILVIRALSANIGLAGALNRGLLDCSYDYVARMDTDDISTSQRFMEQLKFLQKNPHIDVCSGVVEEWSQDFSRKLSNRVLPVYHDNIKLFAKYRSPISHPAVVYKKKSVLESGGYPIVYPEDYPLWLNMLVNGYNFANLPYTLVKMRVANALIDRRGGDFLRGEIKIFRHSHAIGFITSAEMLFAILSRVVVRLSPVTVKKLLYKILR